MRGDTTTTDADGRVRIPGSGFGLRVVVDAEDVFPCLVTLDDDRGRKFVLLDSGRHPYRWHTHLDVETGAASVSVSYVVAETEAEALSL